jgi:Na+-driven multidrug efflux pump
MALRFTRITIGSGALIMGLLAALMWIFAPQIMSWMSGDPEVIALGARCLRIEAWAEFFFGISIVGYGCCIGTGATLVPSLINILSMWVVRIGLALVLIPRYGLEGYWMAMATELVLKGVVFGLYCFTGMFLRSSRRKSQAF